MAKFKDLFATNIETLEDDLKNVTAKLNQSRIELVAARCEVEKLKQLLVLQVEITQHANSHIKILQNRLIDRGNYIEKLEANLTAHSHSQSLHSQQPQV